jgi:putative phosphoribosyl transferase
VTELTPANGLTKRLTRYKDHDDVLVLGIPRGGVPIAFEFAQALQVPLDILLVRKLGAPEQKELAIGTIASGGIRILNRELIAALGVTEEELAATIAV